jgi:hypothetical protein
MTEVGAVIENAVVVPPWEILVALFVVMLNAGLTCALALLPTGIASIVATAITDVSVFL